MGTTEDIVKFLLSRMGFCAGSVMVRMLNYPSTRLPSSVLAVARAKGQNLQVG